MQQPPQTTPPRVSSALFGRAASVADNAETALESQGEEIAAPVNERPRTPRKRVAKPVTQEIKLCLPREVARELKAVAARRGITASALVLSSLRQTIPSVGEIVRAA
jgi:hypothetical protein